MSAVHEAALALSAAGVLSGVLGSCITGDVRASLSMMLELWMAAGLLRLSGAPNLRDVAIAAAVVAVRTVVQLGLKRATPHAMLPVAIATALLSCGRAQAQTAAASPAAPAEEVPETEVDQELAKQLANPLAWPRFSLR